MQEPDQRHDRGESKLAETVTLLAPSFSHVKVESLQNDLSVSPTTKVDMSQRITIAAALERADKQRRRICGGAAAP